MTLIHEIESSIAWKSHFHWDALYHDNLPSLRPAMVLIFSRNSPQMSSLKPKAFMLVIKVLKKTERRDKTHKSKVHY